MQHHVLYLILVAEQWQWNWAASKLLSEQDRFYSWQTSCKTNFRQEFARHSETRTISDFFQLGFLFQGWSMGSMAAFPKKSHLHSLLQDGLTPKWWNHRVLVAILELRRENHSVICIPLDDIPHWYIYIYIYIMKSYLAWFYCQTIEVGKYTTISVRFHTVHYLHSCMLSMLWFANCLQTFG